MTELKRWGGHDCTVRGLVVANVAAQSLQELLHADVHRKSDMRPAAGARINLSTASASQRRDARP